MTRAWGIGIVALVVSGCSLLIDDSFARGVRRSDDAATGDGDAAAHVDDASHGDDASHDDAGADVASPAGANILVNPSFEIATCAGWDTEFATKASSDLAHDGTRGCLVCSEIEPAEAQFYQIVSGDVPAGAVYLGELWVRADTRTALPPSESELGLEIDLRTEPGLSRGLIATVTKPLAEEWEKIPVSFLTTSAGSAVQLFLHFTSSERRCVVVDSARLYRVN